MRSKLAFGGFGFRSSGLFVICLAIILGLGVTPAWSQSTATGTVSGLVVDAQGAAVAGTEVKLLDTTRNKAVATTSNDTGRYIFLNVSPGIYNVTFNKTGFSVYQVNTQTVNVGEVLTLRSEERRVGKEGRFPW